MYNAGQCIIDQHVLARPTKWLQNSVVIWQDFCI